MDVESIVAKLPPEKREAARKSIQHIINQRETNADAYALMDTFALEAYLSTFLHQFIRLSGPEMEVESKAFYERFVHALEVLARDVPVSNGVLLSGILASALAIVMDYNRKILEASDDAG
jgi:hypothetical protein